MKIKNIIKDLVIKESEKPIDDYIFVFFNIFQSISSALRSKKKETNESISWVNNGVRGYFKIQSSFSNINIINLIIDIKNNIKSRENIVAKKISENFHSINEVDEIPPPPTHTNQEPVPNQNPSQEPTPNQEPNPNQEPTPDQGVDQEINQETEQKDEKTKTFALALDELTSIPSLSLCDTFVISISKEKEKNNVNKTDIEGNVGVWLVSINDEIYYSLILNGKKEIGDENKLTSSSITSINNNLQQYLESYK